MMNLWDKLKIPIKITITDIRAYARVAAFGLLFFHRLVFAVQFEFLGVGSKLIYKGEKKANLNESVGAFTMAVLREASDQKLLSFQGSELGLLDINNLTTDRELEDYELISDFEMKAYGWCFTLNDVVSTQMTHRAFFASDQTVLRWYYAYAHYNKEWLAWCIPVEKNRKK